MNHTKRNLLKFVLAATLMSLPGIAKTNEADGEAVQVVQDYKEVVVNGRQFDRIDEFVAEDFIERNPNLPNGREALRQFWKDFMGALPDEAQIRTVRSISDGTMVWQHNFLQRTPDDPGIAAVDIYRVENGLIVEHWDVVQEIPAETVSGNHMVLDQ